MTNGNGVQDARVSFNKVKHRRQSKPQSETGHWLFVDMRCKCARIVWGEVYAYYARLRKHADSRPCNRTINKRFRVHCVISI